MPAKEEEERGGEVRYVNSGLAHPSNQESFHVAQHGWSYCQLR